eukprot:TRINITY_DN490_c0_g1_i1.p1 TRINITY_DN490_c0_g1~~TRINITY_DN490_c0_g1_i1.p1  ORF type:complete len:710 (+),score=161.80 TRINITY_DN490_c0_g1_i1:74-2131(+)
MFRFSNKTVQLKSKLFSSLARSTFFRLSSTKRSELDYKIEQFQNDVKRHLPSSGDGVVLASAFIVSDNVLVDLFHKNFPEFFSGMNILGVDTLHLFPETLDLWRRMEQRYGKRIPTFKPLGCETRQDFERIYGQAEKLSHADFDYYSKIEPFERGLQYFKKEYLITGRRADQGNARIELAIYEEAKKTLNPLAQWSWNDVLKYIDVYDVPYNRAHEYAFRSEVNIDAKERHKENLPWTKVDLKKPFWRATDVELRGTPPAKEVYVYKSFGDMHTSVPVHPHESERSGRFVRLVNTECGIHTRANHPGAPHGGVLVDLMVTDPSTRQTLISKSQNTSFDLTERQACDVELLINGGFSPLKGFMNKKEYDSVVHNMRLLELQLWGVPIVLDSNEPRQPGEHILLKYKDQPVAVLEVEESYVPDKFNEALKIYGTVSLDHPGVSDLVLNRGKYYIGGKIHGLDIPKRSDGIEYRSPAEIRKELPPHKSVVAFQCRNPIHRAHYELLLRAQKLIPNSVILVHPTCGPTQPGDIDGIVRHRTYQTLQKEVHNQSFLWAYLPYSMVMAGPREAIQHMIIRKNFGATHFIIGRDMAGTKSTITGQDFYGPFDAQEFALKHQKELGISVVPAPELVYTQEKGYLSKEEANEFGLKPLKLSGTEFRRRLLQGEEIPDWFAFPSVVNELRRTAQA